MKSPHSDLGGIRNLHLLCYKSQTGEHLGLIEMAMLQPHFRVHIPDGKTCAPSGCSECPAKMLNAKIWLPSGHLNEALYEKVNAQCNLL